jgi:hypothetical protein
LQSQLRCAHGEQGAIIMSDRKIFPASCSGLQDDRKDLERPSPERADSDDCVRQATPNAAPPATGLGQHAQLSGGGALAQGQHAVAVGTAGVYVGGDNSGNINIRVDAPARPPPTPFQAPPPAPDHVHRSQELARIKAHLLGSNGQLLASSVGLCGFGGAGKTTLARLLCADPAVLQACRDGILWVPLGKNPPDPRAQIADLVSALRGDCDGCTTLPGARAQLLAALAQRTLLLVLDDVWDEAQIRDIVAASGGCARLITTRNALTLPFEAELLDVGNMQATDARELLGAGLPAGQDARLLRLVSQLGYWPVLLRLANRTLRQRIGRQKMPIAKALDAVERDLARKGVLAFDPARDALERDQAVAATVEASLELLDADERQRYAELVIFPQDVPIPLASAAELWQITAGLDATEAEELVSSRLEPLSLLDYDAGSGTLRVHDVLRSYLSLKLTDKAALHLRLAEHWGERPAREHAYAWRWLAFHLAQAALASAQPQRHVLVERLLALVGNTDWQQAHEQALADLPALRAALSCALDAAVSDDLPLGVPLIVDAADTLTRFRRQHLRPEPIFELARQGDLDGARRRCALFSLDEHWRQALLLTVAWLAPAHQRAQARALCAEIDAESAAQPVVHALLLWLRAQIWGQPAPAFAFQVPPQEADTALIEELLKRVGGGEYQRELIISRGLDPDVHDPDQPPPTRGIHHGTAAHPSGSDGEAERSTTRYLAELDGPYLVAYAAQDPGRGMDALRRYLSVYTNYNYSEYRFSTLWLLLGFVVELPRPDGGEWVREAVLGILTSALSGDSVEFEQGLPTAATALRAQAQDPAARTALLEQAGGLIDAATRLKPGREVQGSDIWAQHKRRLLASAQALGWLLGEDALAAQVLQEAMALADSGFAGYQAPACLALAEAIEICYPGQPQASPAIEQALEWAQRAAHNVQDPTFCARMTARVNAMRTHWWPGFDIEERARHLAEGAYLPEFAGLHRVSHSYAGRRPDALQLPPWARDDGSFDSLQILYQRPRADFLRLNGNDCPFHPGDPVAVPDPGFAPHLAARLAAATLAQAGPWPLPPERLQLLRSLVPHALASPTALDAVLTRLVLAQARRATPPDLAEAAALDAVLARRVAIDAAPEPSEPLISPAPARLPT